MLRKININFEFPALELTGSEDYKVVNLKDSVFHYPVFLYTKIYVINTRMLIIPALTPIIPPKLKKKFSL